jgi:putative flippase GtrA
MTLDRRLVVEFMKFGTIGVVGFGVDWLLTYLGIYGFGWNRYVSGYFAFPFAVSVTWIGNRLFTFKNAEREPMAKQWAKFASVCAVGFVLNRGTYSLLLTFVPLAYAHPVIGLLGGTAAGMFFNFFSSKKLVFKTRG